MAPLAPFLCTLCGAYLHSFDRLQRHKHRHTMKYIRIGMKKVTSSTALNRPYYCDLNLGEHNHNKRNRGNNQLDMPGELRSGLMEAMYHETYFTHQSEQSRVTGPGKNPKYQCQYCKKCFTSASVLKNHIRTHTKEKPYQCEHCQKWFSQLWNLKKHVRTHTKEKPYQCEHCQKCFAAQSNLKRHIRIHTKEKPYQCEHCQKSFAQSKCLVNHMRAHTEERPYQCDQCPKSFSHSHHLTRHVRTHTEQCRRETIPVWPMPEIFFSFASSNETCQNSHQRETIPVWTLPEMFCTDINPQTSY